MSLEELLKKLSTAKITLAALNGKLIVRGNKQALSDADLLKALNSYKPLLVEMLNSGKNLENENIELDNSVFQVSYSIPEGTAVLTPALFPLVSLTQRDLDFINATTPGGAKNIEDIYPLTPMQQGMFFNCIKNEQGDAYIGTEVRSFNSRADLERYLIALQKTVDRHDALRTRFVYEGLSEPVQVVQRKAILEIKPLTLNSSERLEQQIRTYFDARSFRMELDSAPLIWLYVIKDSTQKKWTLVKLIHHLCIDRFSSNLLHEEIGMHLRGERERLFPPVPFRNHVLKSKSTHQRSHQSFFDQMLKDIDFSATPFGVRATEDEIDGGSRDAELQLPAQLTARLKAQARVLNVSLASLCHLAWAQVLARIANEDDTRVVFGTVLFGRMGGESLNHAIGMYINTLPVRVDIADQSIQYVAEKLHSLIIQLASHEGASLSLAQSCSFVPRPRPLFTSVVNYSRVSASAADDGIIFAG